MWRDLRGCVYCGESQAHQEEVHLKRVRHICHFDRFGSGVVGTDVGVRSCGDLCLLIPRDTLGGVAISASGLAALLLADEVVVDDADDEEDEL